MLLLLSVAAVSQKSSSATVQLRASVETSLTIALSNGTVTWNTANNNSLRPGQPSNPASSGITVTTTWALRPYISSVRLYGYFQGLNALSSFAGDGIPASNFQISTNAGPMRPVNNRIPGYGTSALELQRQAITNTNRNGEMTSALTFNIDLTNQPQLPAGRYTGSLILQAEAAI
jgi:hypothetical protein